jgi:hypothetical protein
MIPKILHQIWIGPKPAPTNLMKTWKDKHPDFEYILWTEQEIQRRNLSLTCTEKIDMISEIKVRPEPFNLTTVMCLLKILGVDTDLFGIY